MFLPVFVSVDEQELRIVAFVFRDFKTFGYRVARSEILGCEPTRACLTGRGVEVKMRGGRPVRIWTAKWQDVMKALAE